MYDVIVVGGGVQGLSTARYLAKSGASTILIDQFGIPHSRGSSHGKSRGIRCTYNSYCYAEMIPEAFKEWENLEKELKKILFVKTGIITISDDDEEQRLMAQNLKAVEVPYELLSSNEIESRFPGFNSCGLTGIYEGSAGILKADECLLALKDSYLQSGGCIKQECVVAIKPKSSTDVEVQTRNSTINAKAVVLTCGSWINDLLKPLNVNLPIQVKKSYIFFCKAKSSTYCSDRFPLSCVIKPDVLYYGIPEFDYKGCVKIGVFDGVNLEHPSQNDEELTEAMKQKHSKLVEKLIEGVKMHYPDLIPEPEFTESCIMSATPSGDFILDTHPRYENVVVGAGFSGHGFKFAPVVGKILGNLALRKQTAYNLEPFSMKRFGKQEVVDSRPTDSEGQPKQMLLGPP